MKKIVVIIILTCIFHISAADRGAVVTSACGNPLVDDIIWKSRWGIVASLIGNNDKEAKEIARSATRALQNLSGKVDDGVNKVIDVHLTHITYMLDGRHMTLVLHEKKRYRYNHRLLELGADKSIWRMEDPIAKALIICAIYRKAILHALDEDPKRGRGSLSANLYKEAKEQLDYLIEDNKIDMFGEAQFSELLVEMAKLTNGTDPTYTDKELAKYRSNKELIRTDSDPGNGNGFQPEEHAAEIIDSIYRKYHREMSQVLEAGGNIDHRTTKRLHRRALKEFDQAKKRYEIASDDPLIEKIDIYEKDLKDISHGEDPDREAEAISENKIRERLRARGIEPSLPPIDQARLVYNQYRLELLQLFEDADTEKVTREMIVLRNEALNTLRMLRRQLGARRVEYSEINELINDFKVLASRTDPTREKRELREFKLLKQALNRSS